MGRGGGVGVGGGWGGGGGGGVGLVPQSLPPSDPFVASPSVPRAWSLVRHSYTVPENPAVDRLMPMASRPLTAAWLQQAIAISSAVLGPRGPGCATSLQPADSEKVHRGFTGGGHNSLLFPR